MFLLEPRTGRFTEQVRDAAGALVLDEGPGWRRLTGDVPARRPLLREVDKVLTAAEQFSPKWMKRVDASTPLGRVRA